MLEPYEGKLSCTVLRGQGSHQAPALLEEWIDQNSIHFNTTRIVRKSAIDGKQLSEAELEGHSQVKQFIAFFRKHIPEFRNCYLLSMGAQIGIRESRRIKGITFQTREDFNNRAKYPDGISKVNYPIDIHSPTAGTTELVHMPKDNWYEVRYGAVVPRDCDNLLVGGRPVSVDHALHSSLRVMPQACSLGQAAGAGASLSIRQTCIPAKLDGQAVRNQLKECGAHL